MRWLPVTGAVVLAAGLLTVMPARAEHFDITLRMKSAEGVAESGWDTSPPEGGLNRRPVASAVAGEDLLLEWSLRSAYPHGVMKGVRIRLFVAREEKVGQKKVTGPDVPRVLENSFTTDFLPDHAARGHLHFRVMEPGVYLVRLQSENTEKEHGHEHFSALDLQVGPAPGAVAAGK